MKMQFYKKEQRQQPTKDLTDIIPSCHKENRWLQSRRIPDCTNQFLTDKTCIINQDQHRVRGLFSLIIAKKK